MSSTIRQISKLPWAFVLLFDIAAFTALIAVLLLFTFNPASSAAGPKAVNAKRIALSFDDSPRGPGGFLNKDERPKILIAALKQAGVKQAAFFVNPGRAREGSINAENLKAYGRAGHVLANHTAHHLDLSKVPAEKFLADIDAAAPWLKTQRGYRPWFRFPQLDEGGRDRTKRDAIRAGLKARGLRNGYVTADGWDWYLDNLARKAVVSGQPINRAALRDLFVETHIQSVDFADDLAKRALGRQPAQMLLLHDTDLTAMYIGDLVKALRADGWQIITADETYADPIGKIEPQIADANGTLIQMISWDRSVKGPRWFDRNEPPIMKKLFNERVLVEIAKK